MTTETPQPTCPICGRAKVIVTHESLPLMQAHPNGEPMRCWAGVWRGPDLEIACLRLGYEREKSARFAAEERTEEYRRLVETKDEAIAAMEAGIGKDVE